jgi:hypothetical protein
LIFSTTEATFPFLQFLYTVTSESDNILSLNSLHMICFLLVVVVLAAAVAAVVNSMTTTL